MTAPTPQALKPPRLLPHSLCPLPATCISQGHVSESPRMPPPITRMPPGTTSWLFTQSTGSNQGVLVSLRHPQRAVWAVLLFIS